MPSRRIADRPLHQHSRRFGSGGRHERLLPHTEQIRNIVLAGHAGSGKTTLFEALLHAGGMIQIQGSVERGSTQSGQRRTGKDPRPLDRQRARTHRPRRLPHPADRHRRLSRFSWSHAVRPDRGGNRRRGGERGQRHRARHPAPDGPRPRSRGLARVLVVNKIDFEGAGWKRWSSSCARPSATNACR